MKPLLTNEETKTLMALLKKAYGAECVRYQQAYQDAVAANDGKHVANPDSVPKYHDELLVFVAPEHGGVVVIYPIDAESVMMHDVAIYEAARLATAAATQALTFHDVIVEEEITENQDAK